MTQAPNPPTPDTERDPGRRAGTPSTPTPEDPRVKEPIHDPPVHPDDVEAGVEATDPSPDDVVIDENETEH